MLGQDSDPNCQSLQQVSQSKFYEVEAILDKKLMKKNGKQVQYYLVRWEGFPKISDHTWEPISHLYAVQDMINDFEQARKINKKKDSELDSQSDKNKNTKQNVEQRSKGVQGHKKHKLNEEQSTHKLKKLKRVQDEAILNRTEQQFHKDYLVVQQNRKQKSYDKTKQDKTKLIKQNGIPPPKRTNPFVSQNKSKGINDEKQSTSQNLVGQYGKILNHIYKDAKMFYEVELLNKQKKTIKNVLLPATVIRGECTPALCEYLQKYLIDLEQYNKQK